MINTVTIITDDYSLLQKNNAYLSNLLISFELDTNRTFARSTLKILHNSSLLENENIHFSFFINMKSAAQLIKLGTNQRTALLQYIFHSKYKILNSAPLFCFYHEERETNEIRNVISFLEELLINNGYKGVFSIFFSNERSKLNDRSNIFLNSSLPTESIRSTYFEVLKNKLYASKFIGINATDIDNTIISLKASEKALMEEEPYLYDHLNKFSQTDKHNLLLQNELSFVKSDLENQYTYIDLIKTEDEALKINTFYKYEYEILPLWYKKVGHIIKVLMGKRTFRSLFDTNVKKYKD
ncbi:MAG: hypothetical protein H0W84_10110 [Bacteroidetes bacterium]|nr:hypothetical protein [Bacteroidota bacterium]